ncbi:HVO_0476 family zinc finger protein [Methanobacterium paludis]|uniref:Uncharacterized protein n=1 Tax=Methanobacterium paludis (strain DSM 25820 / JCM 18151 / SWAN1) TaxID=868131 RepID=F6D6J9_METPW|nr:HVO_0476 family zinc finger protein [Methanobacterium paludis]AEG17712.1 hypothetical protein MSWAN_0677 [Methanobacterium paludis]
MKCPVCKCGSYKILKSKGKTSKELLLQCNECGNIFRETIIAEKPVERRVVVSEYEKSHKKFIKIYPDEVVRVEDILDLDGRPAQVSSVENKRGGRVQQSPVIDIETIWAYYIDIPARVGISVDFSGRILSRKVEVDREFEFTVGDIVKLENLLFKIKAMKTLERKMRKGFAKAWVIKRVYGIPIEEKIRYNYDLTSKMIGYDEEYEER